ncbi:MAG: hypothetical protein MUF78_08080 [Candidatus Edwardsbacteria bacterium]|nr:hypothetical protein [Candidatus Edwardsbacteria bacterium]
MMAALMLAAPHAAGQGFVRWDYDRTLYFPRGWDYFTSALTVGTSDRIGAMTASTYWSYLDDKSRPAALNRFELRLDNLSAPGGRWDLALGDLHVRAGAGTSGGAQVRGFSAVGRLGNSLVSESHLGQAADRWSASNAPAFRDNGWFLSQAVKAGPRKDLSLQHSLTLRRDHRQDVSLYGLPSASQLMVLANAADLKLNPILRAGAFLNLSRAGYGGAVKTDADCGTRWDLGLPAYRADLAYQRKGAQYVGPANEARENGYQLLSLSNSGTVLPGWRVNAAYSQRWPQRGDPALGSNRSQRWSAGTGYHGTHWPVAVYSLERYTAENLFMAHAYRPSHWRHSLDVSELWRGYSLRAGYQNLRSRGEAATDAYNLSNQFSVWGSREWRGWSARASHQLTRQSYRRQLQWTQSYGGECTWAPPYTSGIRLDWTLGRADGLTWGTEQWGWALSQRADWNSGWSLETAVRQRFHAGAGWSGSYRSLQWDLRIEKRFDRIRDAVDFGIARGRVYEDNNGNGRPDPGEPGIAQVAVLLDGRRQTVTADDGSYHVSGIAPGRHTLTVDQRMLSAALDPADQGGKSFTSAGIWGPRIDFPVTPLNKVFGIVFADSNRNGVQDPGEPGLPGAYVLMGEQRTFTSSDEDGWFRFYNVRPGRYQVFMDPKFLPDTLEVSGPSSHTVEVEDMIKVPLQYFGIARRVRPVRRVVFPPSQPAVTPAVTPRPTAPSRPATRPQARPSAAELKRLRDLGIRQYSAGEYRQALQTWRQLLRIDPGNAEAKRNLARTQQRLDAIKKTRQ